MLPTSRPLGGGRPQDETVLLSWIAANVVGVVVGLTLGLALGLALALPFGQPEGILLAMGIVVELAIVGGIVGLVVGLAQFRVLRPCLPSLRRRAWVGATVLGAVVAWGAALAIGNWAGDLLASVLGDSWLLAAVVIGVVAGSLLSAFQWLALRGVARRAWVWVPAHAVAWVAGLALALATIRRVPLDSSALALVGRAVTVGLAMGVLVSLITGGALLWLLGDREREEIA